MGKNNRQPHDPDENSEARLLCCKGGTFSCGSLLQLQLQARETFMSHGLELATNLVLGLVFWSLKMFQFANAQFRFYDDPDAWEICFQKRAWCQGAGMKTSHRFQRVKHEDHLNSLPTTTRLEDAALLRKRHSLPSKQIRIL